MTSHDTSKQLTLRAAEVARRAPQEWERLVEALQFISEQRRYEMVSSPPDAIFISQGRAREAASLHEKLKNCVKEADQITGKTR